MPNVLLVMIGGAIGAALRYEVSRIALHRLEPGFPWGTLIVNLLGGLLMGAFAGFMFGRTPIDQSAWMFVAVGLLGGFTTFSAFSFEMFAMIEQGRIGLAALYVGGSVLGALGLLAIGYRLARAAA